MKIHLDIGPEEPHLYKKTQRQSKHVLNLKSVDKTKKEEAHSKISLDLKEEIKYKNKQPGRICISGELPRSKQGLGRAPMILAALFMIITLNLGQLIFLGKKEGNEALALASEAFVSLQGASQSFISGEEGADSLLFSEADQLFKEAEEKGSFLIDHESSWLSEPTEVKSLRNLIDAGELMTEVGQHISNAKASLANIPEEGSITEFLKEISLQDLEPAAEKVNLIITLLNEVDLSSTPYSTKFLEYKEKLISLSDIFNLWLEAKDPLLTALGDRYVQHYLVLLMNNDEMRLGGGFIGSFAIAEINDGRLTNLDFKDVYELDNNYFEHIDVPVHELKSLTNEWRLRDSNISADFPSSAEHAIKLLDLEGGPGVDGVIAINLSAAQAMLEDTGPLILSSLSKEINAESFPAVMSTLVEAKVFGEDSPKVILEEFINAFIEKTADPTTRAKLALSALDESHKKQIMFYHRDEAVENLLKNMGMSSDLPQLSAAENDFLMPLFTNIGGNKTDRYMQTDIQHSSQIFSDGSIVNSATITRTHTFNAATLAWLKDIMAQYGFTAWDETLEKVLGNTTNRTGVRIYIPEGSRIIDVKGDAHRDDVQFYYDPEMDMSYYYLDQSVAPGTSKTVSIIYSIPFSLSGEFQEYKFDLFKQPGLKATNFQKTVSAPDDIMLSSYPLSTSAEEGKDYIITGSLTADQHITLLYR